jgi:hypothetical protein
MFSLNIIPLKQVLMMDFYREKKYEHVEYSVCNDHYHSKRIPQSIIHTIFQLYLIDEKKQHANHPTLGEDGLLSC